MTRSRYCYLLKVTCYVTLLHLGKCNLLQLKLLKKVTCYCNSVPCNKLLPNTFVSSCWQFYTTVHLIIHLYFACQSQLSTNQQDWLLMIYIEVTYHHLNEVVFAAWLHVIQRMVLLSQFCLSVCQMHVLWQNEIFDVVCEYLNTIRNRDISIVFPLQWGLLGIVPFHQKYLPEVTHTLRKSRLWQISIYNVSAIRDSENGLTRKCAN